jgi:hypothetical protein
MTSLAVYIRHAEHFGVADVFETALGDLDVEDLGRLSLRLQNLNPKWALSQADRRALALALHERGVDPKTICRMAMISRKTLKRALEEVVQVPKCAPEPAFQSGEKWTKQATEGYGLPEPVLSPFLAPAQAGE